MNPLWILALALMAGSPEGYSPETTHTPAPPVPDASISVQGSVAALGIGYMWGHGTLTWQGRQIGFHVRGMDIGDVAVARVRAEGLVYHLGCVADLAGQYTAASTGAAILRGQSAAVMQNEHGVVIEIESRVTGLRFNLAASRLRISLDSPESCHQ